MKIDRFYGTEYAFLSNFYPSVLSINNLVYKTNEHYFQACKAKTPQLHEYVRTAETPAEAKKRGSRVAIVDNWDSIKDNVMLTGLRVKFSNPILKEKLLATKDAELIEGNTWGDRYWGICDGTGKNILGKLLMQVRKELQG